MSDTKSLPALLIPPWILRMSLFLLVFVLHGGCNTWDWCEYSTNLSSVVKQKQVRYVNRKLDSTLWWFKVCCYAGSHPSLITASCSFLFLLRHFFLTCLGSPSEWSALNFLVCLSKLYIFVLMALNFESFAQKCFVFFVSHPHTYL